MVGTVSYVSWLAHPASWLCLLVALTGVVRILSFVLGREAVGEPLITLALRSADWVGRRVDAARTRATLGPERPDRVHRTPDGLVVLSAREKPDWDDLATIQIGDRFYEVAAAGREPDEGWQAVAYHLREKSRNAQLPNLIVTDLRHPGE